MEEIKFKPKIKPGVIGLGLFLLIFYSIFVISTLIASIFTSLLGIGETVIIFILGFGIGVIIFLIGSFGEIISKIFLTYYLTKDNEIVIEYNFLQKSTKVYRIDQITSIRYRQGWLQQKFGVGTINFDIFGLRQEVSQDNNQAQQAIIPSLFNIEEHREIFENLCNKFNLDNNEELIEEKPQTKPRIFSLFITNLILISGLILAHVILSNILVIFLGVIFILLTNISILISYRRLRKTLYTITNTHTQISHDFLLSKETLLVPISKITNIKSSKNLFSYLLFKIGDVNIYTGGSNDPKFDLLRNYVRFGEKLSQVTKNQGIIRESEATQSGDVKAEIEKNEEKDNEILFEYKTHSIYMFRKIITPTILLIIFSIGFYIASMIFNVSLIFLLVAVGLYILNIIASFLFWKSLKYKFYKNKIIKEYGVINTHSEELYFENLKLISMNRTAILDRLANTGTIYLFTAGTQGVDKSLICIKNYKKIYDELENILNH